MPDEKYEEKEMEKRDEKQEKSSEEKSLDEKHQRDPLGTIIWAFILIWAGLVFLASNLGFLDFLQRFRPMPMHEWMPGMGWMPRLMSAWPLVFLGAGVLLFVEVFIRLAAPAYRRPIFGTLVLAIVLISIALGDLVNWGILWSVLLIGLGLSIILRSLRN